MNKMTDKERYQSLINRVEKARKFPNNTTPASRHVAMIGRHLIDDGMSFSLDGAEKLCGESMLLTVADLWETKSMVDDLAILVRRLSNILKKSMGNSKLSNDAMDYIKKHGLDYDYDADSNNQAAG